MGYCSGGGHEQLERYKPSSLKLSVTKNHRVDDAADHLGRNRNFKATMTQK
jgi:hypothetical protein